jgi:hypothetical protein
LSARADIYVVNTTDERLTWELALPNGDTKKGEIKENTGYGPTRNTVPAESGVVTTFKIVSESGDSAVEVKGTYTQVFVLVIKNGAMQLVPGGWTLRTSPEKREMKVLNATGQAQTFDIIDEKEIRSGLTLQQGQAETYPAKNGFTSSGFHTFRFADGSRVENRCGLGDFLIMYMDKRSPGKIQIEEFGHVTDPKK